MNWNNGAIFVVIFSKVSVFRLKGNSWIGNNVEPLYFSKVSVANWHYGPVTSVGQPIPDSSPLIMGNLSSYLCSLNDQRDERSWEIERVRRLLWSWLSLDVCSSDHHLQRSSGHSRLRYYCSMLLWLLWGRMALDIHFWPAKYMQMRRFHPHSNSRLHVVRRD